MMLRVKIIVVTGDLLNTVPSLYVLDVQGLRSRFG